VHHFHHLFTSLRIKENESATNFFRRFTFARTEAEGVGNTYQEASLVNFALAGLAMSKNPKYDTAVQLYNLERDGGKMYTLEDVEKKFFAIDEKISRETASCRIAQGNMAMGQRGDSRQRTHRGLRNPRRNGHRKPESANAATDSSTRFSNMTCFACGKKGHTASYCPEKKKDSKSTSTSRKQAEGHVAIGKSDSPSSELVCIARDVMIPYVRPPRSGPAPVITVDLYAREMLDTNIFVSLAIRVDESMICWECERALKRGHLPSLYEGDVEPIEDGNPLWVLLHNRPFNDLEPRAARIIYPDHRARTIFTEGIIPVLQRGFNVTPHQFPRCYRYWHSLVHAYIERRLEIVEQGLQLPVTVGVRNRTIVLTFYPMGTHPPALISMGHTQYIIHPTDPDEEFERAFVAISQIAGAHVVRKRDPTIEEIGNPADLNNYLPDSGATQHMTPRLADLVDAVEGQNLGVEVADGHIIKCTMTGKIKIRMLDDNGEDLEVTLTDVMYVPGLSRRLFSVSKFARHGFHAMIKKNATTLFFTNNGIESPVTLQSIGGGKAPAADLRVHGQSPASHSDDRYHYVPSLRNRDHSEGARRLLSLEVLHNRLGHRKCRTLLAASEHHLWGDAGVLMTPEAGCLDCGIATIRANARNKQPHTAATRAGEHLFLDVLYVVSPFGLTHATTFPNYLLIVDAYSHHSKIYGLGHKSSSDVISALKKFQADHSFLGQLGQLDTEKIRADSGGEFDSGAFTEHCISAGIKLVLAAPKKQSQNHLAERTWQTISSIARSLLVHASLPDTFWYQALQYATCIFNVIPVRGLKNHAEFPATPHELFYGSKPLILSFRVFGCPSIVKRWVADERGNGKQTERGMRGVFIGFDTNKKGYLFYMPGSRNILSSADATFDESFHSPLRPHGSSTKTHWLCSLPTATSQMSQQY
jgi:transposase InsO family protein